MRGGEWLRDRWWRTTIRARLAIVLSVALAPVLVLSAVQSMLIFQREAADSRAQMIGAVGRSAATVSARIASAGVLLRTLQAGPAGPSCSRRLADLRARIPGYANLIRFDGAGKVVCAAVAPPADALRSGRAWFRSVLGGSPLSVTADPGPGYADEPVLAVSVPTTDPQGRPDGAFTSVLSLASLRPQNDDRAVPVQSEVALTDGEGRLLTATQAQAFPLDAGARISGARIAGEDLRRAIVWTGRDHSGSQRVFTAGPVRDEDLWVLISAPSRDVLAWAWVNPVSAILLPLLAFLVALGGVWLVADRGMLRWIAYLHRIAGIYARGRYGVHPDRAQSAAPEIRGLAQSLDSMAATIAARDRSLRESLIQKDHLLREIHHRVKNNLQVISSLLNMQQRALSDPVARAAMSDTRQRITALALIYRALYEGPDLRKVDLQHFLEDLIAQLVMNDSGVRSNITTDLAIDAVTIDPDHLAPLALFAVEAITNARKHGLDEAGGRLTVTFRVCGATAELAIGDSGRPHAPPPVVGEGVGRTLMTAFARQLSGAVVFVAEPGGGLTARLTFPTPLASAAGAGAVTSGE